MVSKKPVKRLTLNPSGDSADAFVVVKMVNTIEFNIGQTISGKGVQRLLDSREYEITVVDCG